MRFQELKGSSRFFTFCRSLFRHFFLRLPVASVVSFQVPFKGGEAGNTRFFGKILPNGVEIFSKTEGSTFYFQSPLPYLCTCTITVDAKRKDHVEERKSERQMKIETSRKFLDCTIIAYSFLRNGYNYCRANVFRKNGNRIKEWHSLQRNSGERRVWLVHASCIGFSPRLCSQA